MSTQDLNHVHRRYVVVSSTFKSAWTFHQFVEGLRKIFPAIPTTDRPADFQSIYGELKGVAENLSETSIETAARKLDQVERRLQPVIEELLVVDQEISPGQLRQFFQRVKNFEDKYLTHLVQFYLHSKGDEDWNLDRLDKADFLSTRVAEEYNDSRGAFVLSDRTKLRELSEGFWAALNVHPIAEDKAEAVRREIAVVSQEIRDISSIDELNEHALIARYRALKHSLGDAFFQPAVWLAVLEANLLLKNHIQQLYRQDEQRIVAEYQQVFELERDVPVDVQLGAELNEFRDAVERFEQQLQGENVRLVELAELRERVRDLVPKLRPDAESFDGTVTPEPNEPAPEAAVAADSGTSDEELIEARYQAIVTALDDTNPTFDPKRVVLQPDIFSFGLSPREVVAYRRLFGGASCDRGLEQFMLHAAALRAEIEHQADEIKSILDDTAVTGESPVYAKARQTARLGDRYVRRFEHLIEQAVLLEDTTEARALQLLKMRMMRGFSGLWLMVNRG